MSFVAFLFFVFCSIIYIWNGNDRYNSKDWLMLVFKFFISILLMIVFGFMLKALSSLGVNISVKTGKLLTGQVGLSLVFIVGLKFLVVGLCSIFCGILDFHKKNNTNEVVQVMSFYSKRVGPALLIGVKLLISIMSTLIYYGIWFGMASA